MDCYHSSSVRKKSVLNQHKAICCDHYNLLKCKNENRYCILCTPEILSILSIPKENLNKFTDALVNLNNFTDDKK